MSEFSFSIVHQERQSRWKALIRPILIIPIYIVLKSITGIGGGHTNTSSAFKHHPILLPAVTSLSAIQNHAGDVSQNFLQKISVKTGGESTDEKTSDLSKRAPRRDRMARAVSSAKSSDNQDSHYHNLIKIGSNTFKWNVNTEDHKTVVIENTGLFSGNTYNVQSPDTIGTSGTIIFGLVLMILFRGSYPRWWFNWNLEFTRFLVRILAYSFVLTDKYPSVTDAQDVKLQLNDPDRKPLNRFLPLVKWFLAIPHFVILSLLAFTMIFALPLGWICVVIFGRYPKWLFDYVEGYLRYKLRVVSYCFLMLTDEYPPFRLHQ